MLAPSGWQSTDGEIRGFLPRDGSPPMERFEDSSLGMTRHHTQIRWLLARDGSPPIEMTRHRWGREPSAQPLEFLDVLFDASEGLIHDVLNLGQRGQQGGLELRHDFVHHEIAASFDAV